VPVTRGRRAHGGRGQPATAKHHLPVHVPPVAVRVETASFGVRLQDFEQRRAAQLQVDGRKRRAIRAVRVPLRFVARSVRRLEQAGHGVPSGGLHRRPLV